MGIRKLTADAFRGHVMDDEWWKKATYLVELLALPFKVMRATDSSAKGMIGTIYDLMLQLTGDMMAKLEAGDKILTRADVAEIWKIAFIARHYDGKTFTNKDGEEKRASLLLQEGLTAFLTLEGSFGLPEAIADREAVTEGKHSMVEWWGWHGTDHPHLASLACRALTQPVSASPCERGWASWESVHTARRNKLGSEKLRDLVY
ncbi:unnamed protein product, partial [Closterium sp. NIES-54]